MFKFIQSWWQWDKVSCIIAGVLLLFIITNPVILIGVGGMLYLGSRVLRVISNNHVERIKLQKEVK